MKREIERPFPRFQHPALGMLLFCSLMLMSCGEDPAEIGQPFNRRGRISTESGTALH